MKEIRKEKKVSVAKGCKIVTIDRSMYYYESVKDDTEVEEKLRWYAEKYPARGFPEYFKRIRREGLKWNHKRVRRVYLKLGIVRRRKIKRRIPNLEKTSLLQPIRANITWCLDFMEDRLENVRKFRTLNILDDYNSEALSIEADYSIPAYKVVKMVKRAIEWRGQPEEILTDNGPEFIAKIFEDFCSNSGLRHTCIQKGKPSQNGYVERFNRSFREDLLDVNIFLLKILSQLFRLGCASFSFEFGSKICGTLTHVCVLKVHYGWTSCIGQFENGVVSHHKDNRPLSNNIYFCKSRSLTL